MGADSFKENTMIPLADTWIIQDYDVFGNKHEPYETNYCPCWQCPKPLAPYNGINEDERWWRPNPWGQYTWEQRMALLHRNKKILDSWYG